MSPNHVAAAIIAAIALLIGLTAHRSWAEEKSLGVLERAADVGQPKIAGSTAYDAGRREFTLTAAGANVWADHDEFQFAWKRIQGNFIVTTRGHFITEGGAAHKKFG